jgi:carbon-monoxide dehydrogenase small subunit
MQRTISLTVNGRTCSGTAEGRTLLAQFLRETLGLTGTHIGCDTSQCGCCIVHLDGAAVKSCAVLVQEVEGCHVTTIEGAGDAAGGLSRLQQAFVDEYALQCGFCTPGMVMSASALLDADPQPDVETILHHLEGNICRCTGYQNIVRAILSASGQAPGQAMAGTDAQRGAETGAETGHV